MTHAIIRDGKGFHVYLAGKLIGTVKTEDEAWALVAKTRAKAVT